MSDFVETIPPVKPEMYSLNNEKSELNSAAVFLLQDWNSTIAKHAQTNNFVFIGIKN
ncbi:hypothetical protein FNO01nite_03830 [Flavobacterium noncentrifugens]|nr:hypothetical protein FNO01nite_03830 [Flavobacterium noncentrifugens]